MCVCGERERKKLYVCEKEVGGRVCSCVCVCVRERERVKSVCERERVLEKENK